MTDVRLFCSDLDGTLIGNPESTVRFRGVWEQLPQAHRPILCFSTGRLIEDVLTLIETSPLPRPDYILGGVGTQLWDYARGDHLPGFEQRFAQGWDLEQIESLLERIPGVVRQPPNFLHPYKSSWYLNGATPDGIASIEGQLRQAGLQVAVVYSGQRYLDVLPKYASKGKALAWLAHELAIAQVSPFGFSWRCDVWGNLLAFLFNIIDVQRARAAFEFMWGVGVNEPFPARNLYPPVLTGDPEWRPYFTVNLLNLPGHYHNGGIWPHIGGMWVRFIHRLGMRDLACRELVKLAELNHQGIRSEWEFNEWAHAETGRPMGKRFQAWAAASYLRACQELELVIDESDHD